MENYLELISLINNALKDVKSVVAKSKWMRFDNEPIHNTQKLLLALRAEVEQSPNIIDERILRGMHDLGMSAFKEFENTPLEDSIEKITSFLYKTFPTYRDLKPLGADFGKGVP